MSRKHFALIAHQVRVHGGDRKDILCFAFVKALSREYGEDFTQHTVWFVEACGCEA